MGGTRLGRGLLLCAVCWIPAVIVRVSQAESNSTTALCPIERATSAGVLPTAFSILGEAEFFNNSLTTATLPDNAPKCSAVWAAVALV